MLMALKRNSVEVEEVKRFNVIISTSFMHLIYKVELGGVVWVWGSSNRMVAVRTQVFRDAENGEILRNSGKESGFPILQKNQVF